MTQLLINVVDISGGTHPDDKVRLWAPQHRPDGERVVSTSPVDVKLTDGQATVEVLPGPARVQIMTQGVVDSAAKRVTIPDEPSVTLRAVIEDGLEWEPEVISRVARLAHRVETVANTFGSLEGVAMSVQAAEAAAVRAEVDAAAAEAGATQTGLDRTAVAADRTHIDSQVEAINTAFTESVPPYLQPDSPGGLRATYQPMNRVQRLALADRITAWLSTELENDRGDWNMQALLRRLRLRKTTADAPVMFAVDAVDEQPQSTGAGISLQFLAECAKVFPERSDTLKPLATRVAETLISMQCQNPHLPMHGGFMAAPGQVIYNGLGTGQVVKGLISAYEVWGVGQWLESAKLGGKFLMTLIDPNPTWQRLYGHDAINLPAGAHIICDRMGSSGQLTVTASAWTLAGVHALYRLSDITGDETYRTAATPVRDFMAETLTGFYDYYATAGTPEALAAGTVTERFPLESTAPQGTNAFQRRGDANNTGTIESDSMEYALTALWHTGYDIEAIKTAYEHLASLVQLSSAGTAAFRAEYDATGRLTCWPGYFRIGYQGGDWAFGGYYDSQGAGELLAFKKMYYPDHYELSFDIIRAIIEPDRGALLTTGYETLWSSNGDGTVFAVQGVIPIAVAGLGLLETTDLAPMEVSA